MNFGFKKRVKQTDDKLAEKLQKQLQKDIEKNKHRRSQSRDECFVPASIIVLERGIELEGVILEASLRGMTFRPSVSFIEERTTENIQVVLPKFKVTGEIRSSRPDGYGIFLFEAMTEAQLAELKAGEIDIGL